MKKIILFLGIVFCACGVYSQSNRLELKLEGDTLVPVKKVNYSLQTGSMFYAGSLKGSTFYVAPGFSYIFSKKFSMEGGIMFMNNNYTLSSANQAFGQPDTRLFSQPNKYETVVYAHGNYQVNNKLSITGSVIKNFTDNSAGNLGNKTWNNSFQMMSMGLNYKLTPNVTIGAGVRMVQGSGLYDSPSMYNFNSPIYPSAFNSF